MTTQKPELETKQSGPLAQSPAPSFIGGYNGKLLRVNLTDGTLIPESLDSRTCRQYVGGAGFIAYYLWKELKAGIDPLGPENKLIFAMGPITGLTLPGASRHCIGAKSPLTGGIIKSEVGGFWTAELKRAGYDAIIIEGKSPKPVYLWINDGQASLKDASKLWGQNTLETETAIRKELGDDKVQVAMIGPGGENQALYACVMEGCHDAAGRGGSGAVMGSKNLKAIAVRGHTLPPVADPEKLKAIRMARRGPHPMSELGTGGLEMLAEESLGNLPVRNFREGLFPEVDKIHGQVIKETIRLGMEGCFACPIRCKKICKFEEPYKVDPAYGGPEYETLASLGSDCGISDLKAIVKGNELCNAYSLDTISTGSTIAFAMECYEKGLLTKADTGGLDLTWGNASAMLEAIELIAHGQGFGKILGQGTARMAKKIGRGSEEFAMHCKGLEPGMHEPRRRSGLALSYMFGPIGADHCQTIPDAMLASEMTMSQYHNLGWHSPIPLAEMSPRKIDMFRIGQFLLMANDSMALCVFAGYSPEDTAEALKAVTGWGTGPAELVRIGERILNVMRLFNLREGFTGADDKMPERFYQPKTNGVLAKLPNTREAYEKARKYYYKLMCWDENGVPLPEKIEELEINPG